MFKEYYTNCFSEILGLPLNSSDGLGDKAAHFELSRLGFSIPTALFDYYSIAGNHQINKQHNILRSLHELEWFAETPFCF